MRLLNYLKEEYIDSTKSNHASGTYEIYKNPTSKDMSNLKEQPDRFKGFRIIADFDNKCIYISNSDIIHEDMFKCLYKTDTRFRYNHFIKFGDSSILTFQTVNDNMKGLLDSDALNYWYSGTNNTVIKSLRELYNKDYSWLDKWFNSKDVKDLVGEVVLKLTEKG